MKKPGLILFDDRRARDWQPFSLTRPVGELLFGAMTLAERAQQAFGLDCLGYLTSDHLIDFDEPDSPRVMTWDEIPQDIDLVYWCARAAPTSVREISTPDGPTAFEMDGQTVGGFFPSGQRPDPTSLDELSFNSAVDSIAIEGRVLEWVWDLLLESPEQLALDLAVEGEGAASLQLPEGVHVIGDHALELGRDVRLEPGTVFDLREGPIRLGHDVEVHAGTRLAGPAIFGAGSLLLGGSFDTVSAGPHSYLRGELADSVVLGYTNKAHDGYIGHSYLGKWVNLGALTTNSDLKNNYHPVRVWTPSGLHDSGRLKVGCFMGDHAKTGIGLMLGTGTVVGAGANLFGNTMPPRNVQPFSWGQSADLAEYRLADFLETARLAMARRGVELDERGQRYLESCWRVGRGG